MTTTTPLFFTLSTIASKFISTTLVGEATRVEGGNVLTSSCLDNYASSSRDWENVSKKIILSFETTQEELNWVYEKFKGWRHRLKSDKDNKEEW